MEFLVIYLICCALVAALANAWNKQPVLWFMLALIISPLIAGLILVLIPRGRREFPAQSTYRGVPFYERKGSFLRIEVIGLIDGQEIKFRSPEDFRAAVNARLGDAGAVRLPSV